MVFTCMRRNLDIHNPVRMINISIVVSDCCILFVQVCAMFVFFLQLKLLQFLNLRKMRAPWLIAGLALLNANTALQIWLIHLTGGFPLTPPLIHSPGSHSSSCPVIVATRSPSCSSSTNKKLHELPQSICSPADCSLHQ